MQRMVNLYHTGLGRRTRQPASAAEILLGSGWSAADQQSADTLGVDFTGGPDDENDEKVEPQTRTAKQLREQNDRPNVGAPKADWVAYAKTQGFSGDSEKVTKEQLIEEYGGN